MAVQLKPQPSAKPQESTLWMLTRRLSRAGARAGALYLARASRWHERLTLV